MCKMRPARQQREEVNMDKFTAWFKANLKIILAVGIPLVAIAIIFALPLKVTTIPVTESYWATEMRTENYTTTETFTDMESYTASETRTETIYNQSVGYGSWNKTFQVDHPGATVSIEVNNYYSGGFYAPRYYIIGDNTSWGGGGWPYGGYYNPGWYPWDSYYGGGWGGGQAWATIRVTYPEQITKYRPVTKTRDVVKYREVPTQVRKERTVMQPVRMSIWESLFR